MQIREMITMMADTPVEEITRLLIEHRVERLPVVEDQYQGIGIVTERDLSLKEEGMPFADCKILRSFRSRGDSVRLMAWRHLKSAPGRQGNVPTKGDA
jgi:CBS-domain-containing membrane protein